MPDPSDCPFTFFVLDTRTSWFPNMPVGFPTCELLHVSAMRCMDPAKEEPVVRAVYGKKCNPTAYIPVESTAMHGIKDWDVRMEERPTVVAGKFVEWVKENTREGTAPCIIAHNAPFHRCMLYKALGGDVTGPRGSLLPLVWCDSLGMVRDKAWKLERKYWRRQSPYALKNVVGHLVPGVELGGNIARNADDGVRALDALFTGFLYQYLLRTKPSTKHLINPGGGVVERTSPVDNMEWFYNEKVPTAIASALNIAFKKKAVRGKMEKYCVNVNTLHVGSLLAYGKVMADGDDPPLWNVCREVERLLRMELGVRMDKDIAKVIGAMCGVLDHELYANCVRDIEGGSSSSADEDVAFFPCMWGEAEAFLPFTFTEEERRTIGNEMEVGTASELYYSFAQSGSVPERAEWLSCFNDLLSIDMSMEEFLEITTHLNNDRDYLLTWAPKEKARRAKEKRRRDRHAAGAVFFQEAQRKKAKKASVVG